MSRGLLVIGTRRYSSWSLRGWLAVQLAGLEVEERVVPLTGGGGTVALKGATPAGLVPYLEHDGARVWETIAICEYCAEFAPLWPEARVARAAARSAAAEMHAGFAALRRAYPMNLGRTAPLAATAEVAADIARIEAVWREGLQATPFLYSERFGAADAMFAPVVARLLSYQPAISAESRAYCDRVRSHPLVTQWYDDAAREPASWQLAHYETIG